eukprot:2387266-Pyramimonas_sp.AAC.1
MQRSIGAVPSVPLHPLPCAGGACCSRSQPGCRTAAFRYTCAASNAFGARSWVLAPACPADSRAQFTASA